MNNAILFIAQITKNTAIVESENLQQMKKFYFKTSSTEFIEEKYMVLAHMMS